MDVVPPVARLALPDGRALAFRAYGPEAGAPVLFVPGAASGSRMHFGTELLDRRGLRLLGVDRPGLGRSDAHAGKTLATVGDLGATLVARIPTAERLVVPGVGGSLLWARPDLVLDATCSGHPRPRT